MDDLNAGRAGWNAGCGREGAEPPSSVLRHAALYRVFKAVQAAFRHRALQQMRAEGIDTLFPGAAPLLLHLGDEDGPTLSELARRCELENSTLTPLVDDLERQGLVARVRDPDDRRVIRIRLTERGRELEPKLRGLWLRLQQRAMAGIPPEDLDTVQRTLHRMVCNLNEDEPA